MQIERKARHARIARKSRNRAFLHGAGRNIHVAMFLDDPEFCESRCPVCTRARRGNRLARVLQKIEMAVTFGGCPAGRARWRKYGVEPDQPIRPQPERSGMGNGTG